MLDILINGQALDMAADTVLSVEINSPVYSEVGSMSLPVTLPPTPHNLRLLGFPTRIDAAEPSTRQIAATLRAGHRVEPCLITVADTSPDDGINVNVGFANSLAYVQWREMKLADIPTLPTITGDMQAVMKDIAAKGELSSHPDLAVFSLTVQRDETDDKESVFQTINPPGPWDYTFHEVIDGEKHILNAPANYGHAPFVRVWRLLELIMEALGVEVEHNALTSEAHPDLRRLTLLHSCIDALCPGEIRYKDLMPDCTVAELLQALWTRFGLVVNVDMVAMTVRLELIDDILQKPGGLDLTPGLCAPPSLTVNAPQFVTLEAEGAPDHDRWPDFLRRKDKRNWTFDDMIDIGSEPADKMSTRAWFLTGEDYEAAVRPEVDYNTAHAFNWKPDSTGEPFSLVSTDNSFPDEYPGATRHYFSRDNELDDSGAVKSSPLAFALAYTHDGVTLGLAGSLDIQTLTPLGPGSLGDPEITNGFGGDGLTLFFDGQGGLYQRYWLRFDELLRHAPLLATATIKGLQELLSQRCVMTPVLLQGVRCLIERVEYDMGSDLCTVTLRSMQPQGSYDMAAEAPVAGWTFGAAQWTERLSGIAWHMIHDTRPETLPNGTPINVELPKIAYARYVQRTTGETLISGDNGYVVKTVIINKDVEMETDLNYCKAQLTAIRPYGWGGGGDRNAVRLGPTTLSFYNDKVNFDHYNYIEHPRLAEAKYIIFGKDKKIPAGDITVRFSYMGNIFLRRPF